MNKRHKFASLGVTILRVVVGAVFLMHGQQKLFVMGFHGVTGSWRASTCPCRVWRRRC